METHQWNKAVATFNMHVSDITGFRFYSVNNIDIYIPYSYAYSKGYEHVLRSMQKSSLELVLLEMRKKRLIVK